jgi:hypothetical protein
VKKSQAILSISEKLQKNKNLLDGYKNGSLGLKALCDNLATIVLDHAVVNIDMSPPKDDSYLDYYAKQLGYENWDGYLADHTDDILGGWEDEE